MEDVLLRMPTADVAMFMQFATRMGWLVEKYTAASPYTKEQARERLAIAKEQFRNGQYQTHEQVMKPRSIAVAV